MPDIPKVSMIVIAMTLKLFLQLFVGNLLVDTMYYCIQILMFWNFILTLFARIACSSRWKLGLRIVFTLNLNTVKASMSLKNAFLKKSLYKIWCQLFYQLGRILMCLYGFQIFRYHLKDIIIGKIYFLLVRIKLKNMELEIRRRESTGSGPNTYVETETLAKFELMDGAPVRGTVANFIYLTPYFLTYIFNITDLDFSEISWIFFSTELLQPCFYRIRACVSICLEFSVLMNRWNNIFSKTFILAWQQLRCYNFIFEISMCYLYLVMGMSIRLSKNPPNTWKNLVKFELYPMSSNTYTQIQVT